MFYIVALVLGLLGPLAPPPVVPGMTREQVHTLLGEAHAVCITGAVSDPSITEAYCNWRITVCYRGGQVHSVFRHRK
jgi:hypothetical protein